MTPDSKARFNAAKESAMYQVKATHVVKATQRPACEINPAAFVVKGRSVISPYAGQAQFGHPCEPLPPKTDITFEIDDWQLDGAANWAEVLHRPHDGWLSR